MMFLLDVNTQNPKKYYQLKIAGAGQPNLACNNDPTFGNGDTNNHMSLIIFSTLASN
jgi:hypothetical protein